MTNTHSDTHSMENPSTSLGKAPTANMETDLIKQLSVHIGLHILKPIGFSFRTSPLSASFGLNLLCHWPLAVPLLPLRPLERS